MKVILLGVNSNIRALMFCKEESNQTAISEAQDTAANPPFFVLKRQSAPINGKICFYGYATQCAKVCSLDVKLGARYSAGCLLH
jgi:hypothetical protein